MKLQYKIFLIILAVSLSGIFLVSYSIIKYNSAFEKVLGEQTSMHASTVIYEIDREIYERIQDSKFHASSLYVTEEIQKSNSLFDNMSDRENHIDKIDKEWIAGSNETAPLVEELLSNKGSIRLKGIQEFYSKNNGSSDYPEIFVTNKYGVLVSSTGRTSDYRQNDEEWWLYAKENGVYIEEPSYDESSKSTGLTIATAITDKQGNFIGVIIEVVSESRLKKIIEDSSNNNNNNNNNREVKLLSKKGELIYQSNNTPYEIKDFSNYSFFKKLSSQYGYILTKEEWQDEDKNKEIILSYAKSKGYNNFEGFSWIVLIENEDEEILSPAESIKNNLILFSLILSLVLIAVGVLFSYKMTRSLKVIAEESKKISSGNLDTKINIKSKDEVGELASAFNAMAVELKKSRSQIEEANKGLEEKVSQRTKELEEKNKELEKFNKLTVGRELEMIKLKKSISELEKQKDKQVK